jgi:hypothetical protein
MNLSIFVSIFVYTHLFNIELVISLSILLDILIKMENTRSFVIIILLKYFCAISKA